MQQMINIREVNQHLSKYILSLESGNEIIITKHGQAVAKLVPFTQEKKLDAKQQAALQRLRNKTVDGHHLGGERLNRDSLYER